jgi:hypothetical protein
MTKAAKPAIVVHAKPILGRPSFFEEDTERLAVRIRVGVKSKYRLFSALDEVSLNRSFATAIEKFLEKAPYKKGLPFLQPKAAPRGAGKGEWEQLLLLLPNKVIRAIKGNALIEGVSAAALVATALEWYAKEERGQTSQILATNKRRVG